jgi:hypothetical protein
VSTDSNLERMLRVKHTQALADRLERLQQKSGLSPREFAGLVRHLLESLCDEFERFGELRRPLTVVPLRELTELRETLSEVAQDNATLRESLRILASPAPKDVRSG